MSVFTLWTSSRRWVSLFGSRLAWKWNVYPQKSAFSLVFVERVLMLFFSMWGMTAGEAQSKDETIKKYNRLYKSNQDTWKLLCLFNPLLFEFWFSWAYFFTLLLSPTISYMQVWLPTGYLRYYMFGKLMGICNNFSKFLFSLVFRIVLFINMG